ncbi:MAG: hypothetical protein FWG07_00690 [Treponema sp.]|nr:hypothetical protein [Treponema sp.]
MKKTLDDYLNDPDLVNEPSALREIHAIRLMIHDEIKDMTTAERTAYFNRGSDWFFASNKSPAEVIDLGENIR